MKKYYVSRQAYYYSGESVVEIAIGGLDYSNADMLVAKYNGEGDEYENPLEAAQAAIEICKAWRNDGQKDAKVTVVNTGGYSLEGESMTFKQVLDWGKAAYAKAEKCDHCGKLLPEKYYLNNESDWTGFKFCREYCAEENQSVEETEEVE